MSFPSLPLSSSAPTILLLSLLHPSICPLAHPPIPSLIKPIPHGLPLTSSILLSTHYPPSVAPPSSSAPTILPPSLLHPSTCPLARPPKIRTPLSPAVSRHSHLSGDVGPATGIPGARCYHDGTSSVISPTASHIHSSLFWSYTRACSCFYIHVILILDMIGLLCFLSKTWLPNCFE